MHIIIYYVSAHPNHCISGTVRLIKNKRVTASSVLRDPLQVRGKWGGDGPAIICIHKFGESGSHFDSVLPHLGGNVLAPSCAAPRQLSFCHSRKGKANAVIYCMESLKRPPFHP